MIYCVQDAFDPPGIEFKTFPVVAKHIVKTMLPEQNGKVYKLFLHEGKVHWLEMCIYYIFCIFIILSQPWMVNRW